MDSRNEFVRSGFSKFCQWGRMKNVEFETPYKGGPVPLWKNISAIWFKRLSMVSFVFFVTCMIEFIIIQQAFKGPQKELLD